MIEVNLIPDVKQEFIRAQRMRNMVISLSIVVSLVAGGVVVFLAVALGVQGVREAVADASIKDKYQTLSSIENLDNLVTIQNQLTQVSALNDSKGIYSRVFDVIAAVNPADPNAVKMSGISVDPSTNTLTIEGSASNSYVATDALIKTIQHTTVAYSDDGGSHEVDLANKDSDSSGVTLSDTSYGEDASGSKVLRFKISIVYPTELFSNTVKNVRIVSPKGSIDVTDSRLHVPDNLFEARASDIQEGN